MRYTTRPLSDRTWLRPNSARERSRVDATWTKTLTLLGREIDHLGGRDVVIEIDVREQDLKLDGTLRANARTPEHPAVVVAFETDQHGSMLYRCDRFFAPYYGQVDWQHNVRAIALTLESLRAVDRYGATETGQQYTGFKALPAGRAMPASHMTDDEALAVLVAIAGPDADWDDDASLHRKARAVAHPDRNNGDQTLWDQVEQAANALRSGPMTAPDEHPASSAEDHLAVHRGMPCLDPGDCPFVVPGADDVDLCRAGQANTCSHTSATGIDTAPIGPRKVWRCDHCGLRWTDERGGPLGFENAASSIDATHLERQREWSRATFGPGSRLGGVLDHIRRELKEVEERPFDVTEWADVLILAFDGAWRSGHEPQEVIDAIKGKQATNEARTWPDWREFSEDEAIEHDRTADR